VVLGLVCRVSGRNPLVIGVRLEREANGFKASRVLEHRPIRHDDWAGKLTLVAGELETLLRDGAYRAVVVRTLEDRTPMGAPRLTDASRKRLHLEGVLLEVSRRHTDVVQAVNGAGLGQLLGSSKAVVEAQAAELVGTREELVDAAAAALGALALLEADGT